MVGTVFVIVFSFWMYSAAMIQGELAWGKGDGLRIIPNPNEWGLLQGNRASAKVAEKERR